MEICRKRKDIKEILYTTFVRPHLEYAAPAWSPYRKKEILTLERIQRRATKLVRQFKNLSYEEGLVKLNLTTLEKRRDRGDLIQLFKTFLNINTINWHKGPTIEGNSMPRRYSNQHRLTRPPPEICPQRENFLGKLAFARKAVLEQRYHLGLLESVSSLITKIFGSVNTKTKNDTHNR